MSLPSEAIPVILVARNNLPLTKKAVNSALAQDVPVEVLVVNNASNDGSAQWLQSKPVSLIHTPEQWSLAKCWNVALRSLWKMGFTRALVLNNDVIIRSDTVRLLDEHGGDFVSCVSVNQEEQLGTPGDRTIETLRAGQRERPDFSAYFIRKSVTDAVGWFNEECWPAFYEDNFWHLRCHQSGVKCLCVDLPFLHLGSATIKNSNPAEKRIIETGAAKNRERFRKAYGCIPSETEKYDALFTESSFGVGR